MMLHVSPLPQQLMSDRWLRPAQPVLLGTQQERTVKKIILIRFLQAVHVQD